MTEIRRRRKGGCEQRHKFSRWLRSPVGQRALGAGSPGDSPVAVLAPVPSFEASAEALAPVAQWSPGARRWLESSPANSPPCRATEDGKCRQAEQNKESRPGDADQSIKSGGEAADRPVPRAGDPRSCVVDRSGRISVVLTRCGPCSDRRSGVSLCARSRCRYRAVGGPGSPTLTIVARSQPARALFNGARFGLNRTRYSSFSIERICSRNSGPSE